MQVRKQQLELDMEQQTGSKSEKEYVKAVYCHPASLIYTQSEWVSEVTQSYPTLCDPMDCSLPGSSVHEIFQAWVLEWVAISSSRGSSQPRDRTQASHIVGRCFTIWATREVRGAELYAIICRVHHVKARLDEAQTGIKIIGRNINNLRYADDTTLMAESEELNRLLMKVKEESEKVGLKLNIQKY